MYIFTRAEGYVTCYYNSEAVSRPSKGHFTVENIDPFLCDEIIYCYAGIDDATFEILVSRLSLQISFRVWLCLIPV